METKTVEEKKPNVHQNSLANLRRGQSPEAVPLGRAMKGHDFRKLARVEATRRLALLTSWIDDPKRSFRERFAAYSLLLKLGSLDSPHGNPTALDAGFQEDPEEDDSTLPDEQSPTAEAEDPEIEAEPQRCPPPPAAPEGADETRPEAPLEPPHCPNGEARRESRAGEVVPDESPLDDPKAPERPAVVGPHLGDAVVRILQASPSEPPEAKKAARVVHKGGTWRMAVVREDTPLVEGEPL